MNLKMILDEWRKDAPIDLLKVREGVSDIGKIHEKYLREWAIAKGEHRILERQLKKLRKQKFLYYGPDGLPEEDIKELGWTPHAKVYKGDLPIYMDADQHIAEKTIDVGLAQDKVDILKEILNLINYRNNQYTNIVEHRKFEGI